MPGFIKPLPSPKKYPQPAPPPAPEPKPTPAQQRADAAAQQRAAIATSQRQQRADNQAAIIAARQARRLQTISAAPVGVTPQTNPSTPFNTDEFLRGIIGKGLDAIGGNDIGAPGKTVKATAPASSGPNLGLILILAGGAFVAYWLFFRS
jgi:outer membrane biosynthesis protein TonB